MTSSRPQSPRSPEASINPAPQPLPVRPRSHRRYSIIFSGPGAPENAATPQNRATGASASSRPASAERTPLPDPETAYAHTYYYTFCAHTSPPMSRPLNVQPTLARYRRGLLAYPPFHLRAYNPDQGTPSPTLYVLEGSCSDCDITMRRQAESKVLDRYTHELENLSIQLSLLRKDIAIETCNMSFPDKTDDAITTFLFPSTLELEPEATQAIFEMEDRLDQFGEDTLRGGVQLQLAFIAKTIFGDEVEQGLPTHEILSPRRIQRAQQPVLAFFPMTEVPEGPAQ
ncbi:uncharacterized protein A1O5_04241 [Cladophialophora psammophila CBS 110553]|uniref:Uncharacterized protein n=1 Tax=Cladophialophora psammophila CBS 110553 TaxID=1182543 RepID=W9WXZ6_9EURO|nr:uncharacterized protein A1O5_04241 [Cladophialophora psammophila CBS 110553]EXJ73092.1 hypothetical protein A1O5_04241 [Cladophialophora psammophila CBS 110553]